MTYFFLGIAVVLYSALSLMAAAPGLVGGDAPELTAAAFYLGSAHAPGYPLFITLVHLFQMLPLGTPAFRTTFMSIIFQSATFLVLGQTLFEWLSNNDDSAERDPGGNSTGDLWLLAILAASFVMIGPLIFHQTVSPEVFALHLMFIAFLLRFILFPSSLHFLLVAFFTGLSLSNQHTILLAIPALLVAYRSYLRNTKLLVSAGCIFLLGLSAYLVLPLRASQNPVVNWGNPANFSQFIYHITRTQYGGDFTSGSLLDGLWDCWFYIQSYFKEVYGIGLVFLGIGIWRGRRGLKLEYWVGLFFLFLIFPFLIRSPYNPENNFVNQAFLPPAIIWTSPLFLIGFQKAYQTFNRRRIIVILFLGILILMAGFSSYRGNCASRNMAVEDVARDMLSQMPSRSVLYSEGDAVTFPLAYLTLVRKLRADLILFDRTGGLFQDLYHLLEHGKKTGVSAEELVADEKSYEMNVHPPAVFYTEKDTVPGRPLSMMGLLFQLNDGEKTDFPADLLWNHFKTPAVSVRHDYLSRETAARFYLFRASFDLDVEKNITQGQDDLKKAKSLAFDNSRLWVNAGVLESAHGWNDQAVLSFQKARDLSPDFYLSWYDLGVIADQQKLNDEAIACFQKAISLSPALPDIHERLAFQYYLAKRFQDAIQEWEKVRQLDPSFADAYRNLGYVYMQNNPAYAAQMFRQYLQLAPGAGDRVGIEKYLHGQKQ